MTRGHNLALHSCVHPTPLTAAHSWSVLTQRLEEVKRRDVGWIKAGRDHLIRRAFRR